MLLNYQGEGNVSACSECASLPVELSRLLFDGSLARAAMIGVVLLIILVGMFFLIRGSLLKSPPLLLASALLITLLIIPYLYNYDFILLLVPFAVLFKDRGSLLQKVMVVICYLVPTFAIALYGRVGNISLILVTIILTFLLYLRVNKPGIDVPARAA
jgi:hypothetical protein